MGAAGDFFFAVGEVMGVEHPKAAGKNGGESHSEKERMGFLGHKTLMYWYVCINIYIYILHACM